MWIDQSQTTLTLVASLRNRRSKVSDIRSLFLREKEKKKRTHARTRKDHSIEIHSDNHLTNHHWIFFIDNDDYLNNNIEVMVVYVHYRREVIHFHHLHHCMVYN